MARETGAGAASETKRDGTKVIARNPALKPVIGPIDEEGRFTGAGAKGLTFERRWTTPGIHPYDEVTWEIRSASISNESGKSVFEQNDVEVPSFWSQLATNVVVSKYFRGHIGTPGRERSVKQLIDRVVNTIVGWAATQNYFTTDDDLQTFRAELTHLLLHQKMAFNSPVWFNVGVEEKPQCSACQPYRALVSTPDGMVPIGQLVDESAIGREIYDANGVTRIVAVNNNGFKPVYRVKLRNGNFVEATPDHVVKAVRQRRTTTEWLRVDELEVGMRMHEHAHGSIVQREMVLVAAGGSAPERDQAAAFEASAPSEEEIVAIEELGIEEVYDIQTESGEYLSNNVAVHNCFINSVQDNMGSIMDLAKTEAMLFKYGSGAGVNLSPIRGSKEKMSGGGIASGPVSFMKGYDAFAGVVKSGGKTRRAAKMVILNADHPDIVDFIDSKASEEKKAWALIEAGYDPSFTGEAYGSVFFQNANHSVRVTDEFMRAVEQDASWETKEVTTGEVAGTYKARELFRKMGEAAWICGDPGIQYDTTINDWNPVSNSARQYATNPCSEFSFINDTSCNLSSLNLMKFVKDDGEFDIDAYRYGIHVAITAQEILVDNASYPTPLIELNSHKFRPLGLGYANLGALLMSRGLAYDSDEGRVYAAALTGIMTGEAYAQSAVVARDHGGPFTEYKKNEQPFLRVIKKHRDAAYEISNPFVVVDGEHRVAASAAATSASAAAPQKGEVAVGELIDAARSSWDSALELGTQFGYRNAQVTVLAPTGCLTGGSLVLTDRGLVRLRSLGNPDGDKWQTLDLKVGTDDGPRQATKFFVNGAEPVVSVKTKRGYRIQGTTMHRIKVVDSSGNWQWRRFSDVRAGDRVPLMKGGLIGEPREVPLPPLAEAYWTSDHTTFVPRFMNAELAELVGYSMGDGSLHAKGLRFCVDSTDTDVVDRLTDLGRRLFGLEAAVTPKQGYTEVALHSVRLTLWWEACGFAKKAPTTDHRGKGYESHIPDAVLFSNDPVAYRAFVRGLFEADGNTNNGYAYWSTVSEQFSYDVQSVLLALGFVTTRDTSTGAFGHLGANAVHRLRLLNVESAGRWLSEISFISERKREHLAAMYSTAQQAARHDMVPVGRSTIDRLAPANDRLRRTMLLSLSRTGLVSRRAASALLERTQDPALAESLGYFYDEVASAELGEEQLTYDVSVPDNVTYVANGFVSHNTIAFMMDCDTTGIEPDIALIKYKKMVGEGFMKIVNKTVPAALKKLGYSPTQVEEIVKYIDERETIEGAPQLKPEHLTVFDCAFKPVNGERSIHYMGHVRMMGATQPFLSGAISKTVNMPEAATPDEIADVYLEGWKLGLKAIAIYRDGSKRSQPLSTGKKKDKGEAAGATEILSAAAAPAAAGLAGEPKPYRRRLPDERRAITHKFQVSGHEGYITVGLYPDGQPGEIFLKMAKEGSTVSGLMDSLATMTSIALQYGVPLRDLVNKFAHSRFEPAGFTGNQEIPIAKSIVDYVFRWLGARFLPQDERDALGIINRSATGVAEAPQSSSSASAGAHGASTASAAEADSVASETRAVAASDAPPAPTTEGIEGKAKTTGEAGGPKTTAVSAEPPPAETPAGATDLPVLTNGHAEGPAKAIKPIDLGGGTKVAFSVSADSPSCADCGSIMVRNGSCYKCLNCGSTSGCS
jgi:ribonucleoside-diphosphate reductase alpha chain